MGIDTKMKILSALIVEICGIIALHGGHFEKKAKNPISHDGIHWDFFMVDSDPNTHCFQ